MVVLPFYFSNGDENEAYTNSSFSTVLKFENETKKMITIKFCSKKRNFVLIKKFCLINPTSWVDKKHPPR